MTESIGLNDVEDAREKIPLLGVGSYIVQFVAGYQKISPKNGKKYAIVTVYVLQADPGTGEGQLRCLLFDLSNTFDYGRKSLRSLITNCKSPQPVVDYDALWKSNSTDLVGDTFRVGMHEKHSDGYATPLVVPHFFPSSVESVAIDPDILAQLSFMGQPAARPTTTRFPAVATPADVPPPPPPPPAPSQVVGPPAGWLPNPNAPGWYYNPANPSEPQKGPFNA